MMHDNQNDIPMIYADFLFYAWKESTSTREEKKENTKEKKIHFAYFYKIINENTYVSKYFWLQLALLSWAVVSYKEWKKGRKKETEKQSIHINRETIVCTNEQWNVSYNKFSIRVYSTNMFNECSK